MNKSILSTIVLVLALIPSVSFAKGAPLFFQTGDELFEIDGAPQYGGGYSLGYACKRFGLFGADIWTWDCKMMAVNLAKFSVGDLSPEEQSEYAAKYSLGDRKRNIWNHYGALLLIVVLVAVAAAKMKGREEVSA